MPLPIAQLGYMPSGGSPGQLHRPVIQPSGWEQLAQQAIAAVVTQGLGNAMSRDYATQATAGNPEQIKAGPFVDPGTGQAVPGQSPTPQALGPQDAPWWSRILQGPQMDSKQYGAVTAQRASAAEGKAERGLRASEGKANRNAEIDMQNQRVQAASDQFNQTNQLGRDELSQRGQFQNADLGLRANAQNQQAAYQGGELALGAQRNQIAANPPEHADAATRAILGMASEAYKVRLEQWNAQAMIAKSRNLPPPPQPTLIDAIQEAAQGAVKMGMSSAQQQPSPSIPPIPLVSPQPFNSRLHP